MNHLDDPVRVHMILRLVEEYGSLYEPDLKLYRRLDYDCDELVLHDQVGDDVEYVLLLLDGYLDEYDADDIAATLLTLWPNRQTRKTAELTTGPLARNTTIPKRDYI